VRLHEQRQGGGGGGDAAVDAGCAAGAKTAGAATETSFVVDRGSASQGICEHAAAKVHIAVAASSLLNFSLKAWPFRPQKPRWYPWFHTGQASGRFRRTFYQKIGGATPDYTRDARLVSARSELVLPLAQRGELRRQDR